jgi:phage gpG-like protein
MRVRVEVNTNNAQELLQDARDRAEDLRPVFRRAKEDLSDIYTKHFLSNGNGKWAPLDAEYGAWKSVRFPGAPTLVRSGGLFKSIETFSVSEINRQSARFGTDAPVARFHQYGTWSMPKREIIFEPPKFAKKLAKDAEQYIAEGN